MPNSESQRGAANSARYAFSAIVLGAAIFALSFLPLFAGGRERWTKEQALELQESSMRIQELTHKLGSQTRDEATKTTADDYHQALDRFQSLQGELKNAQARSNSVGPVMRILGLLVAIGGSAGFFVKPRKAAELRPVHTTRTP